MNSKTWLAFVLGASLTGCTVVTEKPIGGTNTGTATTGATGGDGVETADTGNDDTWEPVAIGFEFTLVKLDNQQLSHWCDTPNCDQTQAYPPQIRATLASMAYFSGSSDEYCDVIGFFDPLSGSSSEYPQPLDPPFDLAAMMEVQDGKTESASLVPFAAYEGTMTIVDYSDCDGKLPKKTWGVGASRVLDVFGDMKIGFALGKHTDYQLSAWESWDELEDYQDGMLSMYIAINHPASRLGGSDITFHGEDWTTAFMWEYDPSTNMPVTVEETDGDYYQIVNVAAVPPGGELPGVYINSSAYWYHDFPLMNFDILKDGT